MRQLIVTVMVVLVLLAGSIAHAATSAGPEYHTLAWQEYPDLRMHSSIQSSGQVYPDYDVTALASSQYGEYESFYTKVGLVTCQGSRDAVLAIIHYGMDGYSRLVLRDLPLIQGQTATFSFVLPAGTTIGVTRLMLWDAKPDGRWLDKMVRFPNRVDEQVPGLLAQEWFARGEKKTYFPPWEDDFRPDFDRPGITAQIGWPRFRAVPTADGSAVVKDCSVLFDGRTELAFDMYGPYGKWILDWSSELDLVFHIPGDTTNLEADLVIYIERDPLLALLSQSSLEMTVNGWPLSEISVLQSDDEVVQPYALRVSHYLGNGINTIEIKPNPFAGVDILIHGIELWVY